MKFDQNSSVSANNKKAKLTRRVEVCQDIRAVVDDGPQAGCSNQATHNNQTISSNSRSNKTIYSSANNTNPPSNKGKFKTLHKKKRTGSCIKVTEHNTAVWPAQTNNITTTCWIKFGPTTIRRITTYSTYNDSTSLALLTSTNHTWTAGRQMLHHLQPTATRRCEITQEHEFRFRTGI